MNVFGRRLLIGLTVGAAVIGGMVLNSFYLSLLTQIYVFAVLALSVDLLIGFLGLVPLGHAGIFGTSAYVLAYCLTRTQLTLASALILSFGAGLLVSLLFGVLAVRTQGIYFIMLTLAEGMIVWGVVQRWTTVTGGANGIRSIPRPLWSQSDRVFNFVTLGVLVLCFWFLSRIVSSPFGLSLKGIKQRTNRMPELGYNVFLFKLSGFLISGLIASTSGILFTFHSGYISPSSVNFITSAEAVLMVILGGSGTLWGGILGSFIVLSLENVLSIITNRWRIVLGIVYILTIVLSRDGILGFIQRMLKRTN